MTTMNDFNGNFPPPLTLTPQQREKMARWDAYSRRSFECIAGTLEFLDRKPIQEAEAVAFDRVTAELARRRGGGK